ncbi:type IV secretion system protein, partial [Patescibacteria group bacterium]|nr:type IV secretion system protein [Patescibacteria group bacterium]
VSSLLAATIMLFMLAITYIAIGALLLVRLIALAILIIFSPIAFVGSIMPGVSSHASQWWDNLFKYSFFGPIMILGVIISIKFMAAVGPALGAAAEKAASPTDAPTFIGTIVLVSVPIVLLWTVMGVAQSMSIAGAGAVMGAAQGAMKWAGKNFSGYNAGKWLATKAAPYGIKAGLKKFERDVLAKRGLSPRAFIEGWKQRAQEVEDKTLKPVAGKWRDKMNKFFQKEETHYEDAALQGNILKEQKELSDVSQESEYLLRQFNATEKSNDSRKAQKMAAILRIMFNNNDQNEFMKGFKESVEPEHMKQFIHTKLVEAGMTEEQAAKQMMDYSEIAVSKGNYGNYAMGIYDKDANDGRGTFRLSTPEEQREFSVAKGTNIESQIKLRNWHWNSFLTENADPNNPTGDLHDMGKAMLSSLSQSEVNQVGRARKDFINKLHEKKEQIEQHAVDLETAGNKDQADTVRAFVKEIEKYKFSDSKSKPKSGEEEPKIIVTGGRNTTQKVT